MLTFLLVARQCNVSMIRRCIATMSADRRPMPNPLCLYVTQYRVMCVGVVMCAQVNYFKYWYNVIKSSFDPVVRVVMVVYFWSIVNNIWHLVRVVFDFVRIFLVRFVEIKAFWRIANNGSHGRAAGRSCVLCWFCLFRSTILFFEVVICGRGCELIPISGFPDQGPTSSYPAYGLRPNCDRYGQLSWVRYRQERGIECLLVLFFLPVFRTNCDLG